MAAPKKLRKLPPRGERGRFVKSHELARVTEPEVVEAPTYSPHWIGVGEPIDWQRELTREVLPPRRRIRPKQEKNILGWGVLAAGAVGIGYAFSRLPSKGRRL
jgi:hypothetical protein